MATHLAGLYTPCRLVPQQPLHNTRDADTQTLCSVAFFSLRSPLARIAFGLVFDLPAAGAGFALVFGISANAIPSEFWRSLFCGLGGLLVGATAFARLSVPAKARPA